jgi:FKBP-type peptidyl-prolyl cis-trans isomerase
VAKRAVSVAGVVAWLLLVGIGCGSDDSSEAQEAAEVQRELSEAKRQAAIRRARVDARREARRRRIRLEVRRERQARQREARRREARALAVEEAEAEEAEAEESESTSCDPNYSGACLDPAASDYDCEGGSGDGPSYTGVVTVVGEDRHGLDSDSDGVGCE